jgi:hypothetical protein
MWNWLKKRALPALWRVEMEARIELAEAHIGDLRTRFTRFQNRENMRGARDVSRTDRELADEAAAILNAPENHANDDNGGNRAQSKLDLWKKGVH